MEPPFCPLKAKTCRVLTSGVPKVAHYSGNTITLPRFGVLFPSVGSFNYSRPYMYHKF